MSDDKSQIEDDPLEWLKDLESETRSLLGMCVRVSKARTSLMLRLC